jgi:hypothetical protein
MEQVWTLDGKSVKCQTSADMELTMENRGTRKGGMPAHCCDYEAEDYRVQRCYRWAKVSRCTEEEGDGDVKQ